MTARVAVLVSGSGTNLQALMDACAEGSVPARIVCVISNKPDAYALERARKAGIATEILPHAEFKNREEYDAALHEAIVRHQAEFVCLAGFMRLLTPGFVGRWEGKMINIHPSLLPSFKGLHTHRSALEAGVKFTGCTVHFVSAEMDSGPIIVQAAVPVAPDDTDETLAARVLAMEHRCYPLALRWLTEGKLSVKDGKVTVVGQRPPDHSLMNPEG